MKKRLVKDISSDNLKFITTVHNETLTRLTRIYEHYKKLDLQDIDTNELKHLVHHTDNFVRSKVEQLVGDAPSFGGFKMKKQDFINSLELPDYRNISTEVFALKDYWKKQDVDGLILNNFLVVGNAVVLDEERLHDQIDSKRIYAITEREIEVYQALNNFLTGYNELDAVTQKYLGTTLSGWKGRNPFLPFISTEAVFDAANDSRPVIKIDFFNTLAGK